MKVALKWIGARYENKQRVRYIATDCINLAAGIWEEVSGCPTIVLPYYSPQWHLHQKDEKLLQGLESFGCKEKPIDTRLPGDILVFRFGLACSHVGIFMPHNNVIHALAGRKVHMHRLVRNWKNTWLEKCYCFPGVSYE